jgi:hypothetical protein
MKSGVQLDPQVSIGKPVSSLLPTLAEPVRVADATGFAQEEILSWLP